MYHTIYLEEAATLISAFLNQKDLASIGTDVSIGGLIDLDVTEEEIDGWAFWYGWNPDDGDYPEFFISYETNVYTENSPDDMEPSSESCLSPFADYIYKFPSNRPNTVAGVIQFLTDQTRDWEEDAEKEDDVTISKADVEEFAARFLTDFPVTDTINPFCDYAFSFMKGDEIEEFVDQGSYVRYFFGYDETVIPNQIRLILVSVDTDGTNQISNGFYMMETGWPPNA